MDYDLPAKEKIRISALIVNSKLEKYIELHDLFLKKAGTLRSFIKNLIGISVPFDQFIRKAKEIEEEMSTTIKVLLSTHEDINGLMTSEEKKYMDCLMSYANSLHQTVVALREYQEALYRKSKGEKLDWSTSKDLLARYKQSIDKYREIGLKLNSLSYIVF